MSWDSVKPLIATLTFLIVVSACCNEVIAVEPVTAASKDAGEIYTVFLDNWNGKEHHAINIAKAAVPPTPGDIEKYSACAKVGGDANVVWEKSTRSTNLQDNIGRLPYVHLLDPKIWRPKDPAELISKGRTVESAVETGFSGGLLTLSAISFNSSHNVAAFTYSFVCGDLCGNGGTVIFRRISDSWVQNKESCGGWVS